MVKLAKYLKPYIGMLILAVALLFGQAMADLNLPNYMSNIVNVGIQQGGIENAAPEAISADGLTLMKTFMTDAQKQSVESNYQKISAGDENYTGKYPLALSKDIYVRKGVDEETQASLNLAFGEATWTFINTAKKLSAESRQEIASTDSGEMNVGNIDFSELYKVQPMLDRVPDTVIEEARQQAQANGESMMLQTGAAICQNFYKELGMDVGSIQQGYILRTGLLMLLIALGGGIATVLVGLLASKIAAGVARALRRDTFNKVESFSNPEFDRFSTASLITRTTNDITQIQMLLMIGIRMVCYAPIMGVGGVVMALQKSVSMSWIIALAVIVLIGIIIVLFSIVMPKFKIVQKLIDRLNLVSRENLNGLMVIRAFGTQKFEEERFDKANRDLTKNSLFVNRALALMMPAMMLIMNGVTLLIVWVGAKQIAESNMQVGDMMAFLQYSMQVIMSFLQIAVMFIMVPRAAVSGDRIQEVLATEPVIVDPKQPKIFDSGKTGYVEFKDVSFAYNGADEEVLKHISFTAEPGKTTAFIGATGSGKSTLINLIPRFYDVTEGEVLVNGIDVRDVSQHDLRDQIGYVPQKGVLLSGTISSNLRYGDQDASDEEVHTAAEVAQAMEFIEEKPDRFESEISQGGTNVSGGQKQRLSIARALVKKPPIYIFDDSFSALDFKTDAALRKALKKYTGKSTILVVAQRVSTIMDADQIIVLEDGEIVGKGTHSELLKNCPTYYEIASSQLTKEELA